MLNKARVLLVDDHAMMLEGLRLILEGDYELVGTVEDGRAAVAAAAQLKPDLIILDISMPILNGFEAARQLRKQNPAIKLIFLSMHADADYVREAFRAGGMGYVVKRAAGSELVNAIREVLAGRHYVTPLVTRQTVEMLLEGGGPGGIRPDLTSRQREVLQLVAEGKTAKEIAGILNISVKTVDFHKASIMEALGLRTTAELTRYALERGMVGK